MLRITFSRKNMSVKILQKLVRWQLFYHLANYGVGLVKGTSDKVPKAEKRNSLNASNGTRSKSM